MRLPLPRRKGGGAEVERAAGPSLSFGDYLQYFNYLNNSYSLAGGSLSQPEYEAPSSFQGYVDQLYRSNSAVFTCMNTRAMVFSEARFQFRRRVNGQLGDLFGTPELGVLESPWPNGSTGDLLRAMIQDGDTEGNFFAVREGKRLQRLRPDWVTVVAASRLDADHPNWQRDAEVVGYAYQPGGSRGTAPPEVLLVDRVVHWAPTRDPLTRWRGMSWLTPLVREVQADTAAMTHKLKYFEHGATSNLTVVLPETVKREAFNSWMEAFQQQHEGLDNAYRTMFFGAGAEVKVVGSNLQQVDFKITQGHGETRIAAAAGVPAIIAGFSEGMESGTYSNYGQAKRRFADATLRPLWRGAAEALATVLRIPSDGTVLWYDDRDIPFLAEDIKDRAEVLQLAAVTLRSLIDSGWEPDGALEAVAGGDLKRLAGKHTGLFSVQLQPPGTIAGTPDAPPAAPAKNGKPKNPPKSLPKQLPK